jgi:bifunctional non-homologous end joining protein LigD
MLEKGHLHVRFSGQKLVGDWHLVRTGQGRQESRGASLDDGAGGKGHSSWLMFKAKDRQANPAYDVVVERPESVVSGRQATRGPRRVGASAQGSSARALHDLVGEPMLAQPATSVPDPAAWLFEVKYDGYRLLACKAGDEARLYTRKGHDWTERFPPIADGRRPAPGARVHRRRRGVRGGRPGHAVLSGLAGVARRGAKHARIGFAAFDLLWLDGRDLRGEPLEARRELLEKLLEGREGRRCRSRARRSGTWRSCSRRRRRRASRADGQAQGVDSTRAGAPRAG